MWFIFSTQVFIRHLWQLKTAVFLHRCLICAVLFCSIFITSRQVCPNLFTICLPLAYPSDIQIQLCRPSAIDPWLTQQLILIKCFQRSSSDLGSRFFRRRRRRRRHRGRTRVTRTPAAAAATCPRCSRRRGWKTDRWGITLKPLLPLKGSFTRPISERELAISQFILEYRNILLVL